MKTSKFWLSMIIIGALLITTTGISQEKKSYVMVELSYMLPKIGMEKAFIKAVKEHNEKFHAQDPYAAHLDRIATGSDSGWFVCIMGPTMFSQLDARPSKGTHEDHWDKTVSPTVAKYGRTEYWRYNEKLSFKPNSDLPKLENIWFVDIEDGSSYRFKDLIGKIKKAFEKRADDNLLVYENQFDANDGRSIAFVWTLNSWAELDEDDGGIKKDYEEINGEGSWKNAMDEWRAIVKSIKSEVWEIDIAK